MIYITYAKEIKKCRVWINETPLLEQPSSHTTQSVVPASLSGRRENVKIAIELFVAPRYYAFLCTEYIYQATDMLEIIVYSHDNSEVIIEDTLALQPDTVHNGILNFFAQAIHSSALRVANDISGIPPGVLKFTSGGHGEFGSCEMIFSKATSILIRLLAANFKDTETDQIEYLVRKELDKNVREI